MKYILIITIMFSSLLFGSDDNKKNEKQDRLEKQIKTEMEREKKYAKEQAFYQAGDYDFKGSEVNQESLDEIPEIPLDDLDMNSVYD